MTLSYDRRAPEALLKVLEPGGWAQALLPVRISIFKADGQECPSAGLRHAAGHIAPKIAPMMAAKASDSIRWPTIAPFGMPMQPTVLVYTTRRTLACWAASRMLRVPSTFDACISSGFGVHSQGIAVRIDIDDGARCTYCNVEASGCRPGGIGA